MIGHLYVSVKFLSSASYFLPLAGHQFRAHKAVLAACSQFFHKFFQDFTQEPLVEIEGMLCFGLHFVLLRPCVIV